MRASRPQPGNPYSFPGNPYSLPSNPNSLPNNPNSLPSNPNSLPTLQTSANLAEVLPAVTVWKWDDERGVWEEVERLGFIACVEKYKVNSRYLLRMVRGEDRDHNDPDYTEDWDFEAS